MPKLLTNSKNKKKGLRFALKRRRDVLGEKIFGFVPSGSRILDIGSGSGRVGALVATTCQSEIVFCDPLRQPDLHLRQCYPFVNGSGSELPFKNKAFDISIIVTALHHIADPAVVLREAKRVTKDKIIVIEDVYRNRLERWITEFNDSLLNGEWCGHPHQNKMSKEWLALFKRLDMPLVETRGFAEFYMGIFYFYHALFVVEAS